jgi:hypothetical protein
MSANFMNCITQHIKPPHDTKSGLNFCTHTVTLGRHFSFTPQIFFKVSHPLSTCIMPWTLTTCHWTAWSAPLHPWHLNHRQLEVPNIQLLPPSLTPIATPRLHEPHLETTFQGGWPFRVDTVPGIRNIYARNSSLCNVSYKILVKDSLPVKIPISETSTAMTKGKQI